MSKPTSGAGWALVRPCPKCGKDEKACGCRSGSPAPQEKPTFRLRMEKRRGKPVTVLAASGVAASDLSALLKEVKALCGAGGTLKDEEIELQGEHRERLRPLLAARGYRVKG